MDPRAGSDDVHDSVNSADLVEVNVVDGDVVDLGFGAAEKFEGANGEGLDGVGEWCAGDQVADDGEGATMGVLEAVLVAVVFTLAFV